MLILKIGGWTSRRHYTPLGNGKGRTMGRTGTLALWFLFLGVASARADIMTPGVFAHAFDVAESFSPECPPSSACEDGDNQGDISFTTGIPTAGAGAVVIGADSSSSASAGFGVLHASGNAAASNVAVGTEGLAEGEAGWLDIFTVVSNTLPLGMPVDLRFTAVLEGNLSSSPAAGEGQQSSAGGSFRLQIGSVFDSFGCPDAISPCGLQDIPISVAAMSVNDKFSGASLPSTTDAVVTTFVGARFFAEAVLGADGSAFTAATAAADFSDTGFVTIESLTPGASFTTASGTTYSAPLAVVPEPGTAWLVSIGLAILLTFARIRSERFPLFSRK